MGSFRIFTKTIVLVSTFYVVNMGVLWRGESGVLSRRNTHLRMKRLSGEYS